MFEKQIAQVKIPGLQNFHSSEFYKGESMSASLNEVRLIGNVGSDPEVHTTEGGKRVVNLRLATSTFIAEREFAEWHRLVFWGLLADRVENYVRKGTALFVAGRLQGNQWTDKEGVQRHGVEVVVDSFQLLGSKPASGLRAGATHARSSETDEGRRGLSRHAAEDARNPF